MVPDQIERSRKTERNKIGIIFYESKPINIIARDRSDQSKQCNSSAVWWHVGTWRGDDDAMTVAAVQRT